MKKLNIFLTVSFIGGMVLLGAGCSTNTTGPLNNTTSSSDTSTNENTNTPTSTTVNPPSASSDTSTIQTSGNQTTTVPFSISIKSNRFSPSTVTVAVGREIKWTNNDKVLHTVTANDGSFDSGPILPGGVYLHAFTEAGTSSYHCTVHPSMKGKITIR